ncbi:MAG: NfeD family protein [Opitutaceae bacterium]|nr:NfeD family protein [Opitutaceae bacterium]
MIRRYYPLLLALAVVCLGAVTRAEQAASVPPDPAPNEAAGAEAAGATPPVAAPGALQASESGAALQSAPIRNVLVIPIEGEIADPILYILRRGLKQAVEQKIDVVVLDMNTPGGNLGTTLEILEAIEKFPGHTVTYVNKDAISAGAFISAMTRDIYFAPNGVIGAAAPVSGSGQEIDATMRAKIVSYLKARVRSLSEGKGVYRGEVISAMMDIDYEFKIGDRVLKKKGELLSLTAKEATEQFGDPAQPLLATGIAASLDELLDQKFGKGNHTAKRLEVTWSEELAVFLNKIKPILLGLGLLALFVEYKMQGSGVFAAIGLTLLGIVFASSYVAGLSGHEPILVFGIGLVLLIIELVFFPGVVVMALLGVLLMGGSLVWAMADLWPQEPVSVAWSTDAFVAPLVNLLSGLAVAFAGSLLLARFLPRRLFWDRMVLAAEVTANSQVPAEAPQAVRQSLVGRQAVALTALRPTGTVEVDGERHEARIRVGVADRGDRLRVVSQSGFDLLVEKENP